MADQAPVLPVFDTVQSVERQTTRASVLLVGTMMGGILVANSYIAGWIWSDRPFYSAASAAIGAILLGAPLIWNSIRSLLRGDMRMDILAALAILAAFAQAAQAQYQGGSSHYQTTGYQLAGVVAFFMIISNLIETRTALGARASIESLIRMTPTWASRLLPSGQEERIEAQALKPGDTIRIRPGDNIAADGVVLKGVSSVNQATITGESLPADKQANDEVFSGTTNLTGVLDVQVTRAGRDTTLGRVQKLILQAEQTKAPIMRLIDRYVGWYAPTILMIAGIVLFFTRDAERVIAMIVLAVPAALILATPTAVVAALSCSARMGILIKNIADLERARSLTAVVFDKTGTLTTGELSVTRIMPAPGVDGADLLRVAGGLEQMSRHPVARAIVDVARRAKLQLPEAEGVEEVSGRGVRGTLADGTEALVGRATWLTDEGADMSILNDPHYKEPEGLSTLYVAANGKCLGWVGLEDRTRPEARHALEGLREQGIKQLVMVTGDRWSVARRVAREMGCSDVRAEVLPQHKLELVDGLKAKGHVVCVVGDGVNDAPALMAGDLGIAMGAAGSDVAINSASIALMTSDLRRLPFLMRLSRATTTTIWQNLLFGILFIVVTMTLAGMAYLGPMPAALLHTVAATVVIFNSARLVRFGEEAPVASDAEGEPTRPAPQPGPAPVAA
jgi:Cd2+/Zn2+-exporting ATPase